MDNEFTKNILKLIRNFIRKIGELCRKIIKAIKAIKRRGLNREDIQKKIDQHNNMYSLFRKRYTRSLGKKSQIFNCRPRVVYCRNNL